VGKREEYLRDAIHKGTGPDGREYAWRSADMGIAAHALKAVPLLLADASTMENGDGSTNVTIKNIDRLLGNREYNSVLLKLCVISPRLIEDENDPDEDAVLLWTLREDVRKWLVDQIETSSNLKGKEVEQARSFRNEPTELQAPGVDLSGERDQTVGSVSG
jgi:hypothetical protein